jgi:hypothetical protein
MLEAAVAAAAAVAATLAVTVHATREPLLRVRERYHRVEHSCSMCKFLNRSMQQQLTYSLQVH